MSRPELLKVLAAETSQRDGDTDDITANFAAQVQALHNNAPAGNDSDSDESACNADQDDLEFDAMVLEDMDPEDRREFEQVQKTIEKHQARAKQKEWAVVRKAMMPKAKAKAKAKAKTKAKSKAKTKAKAKASNKANIIKGLKTAKSSSSKVASKASRKIWHGALKKKRQDCPALREGDTHEKGNVLVEVPEEVEAVTPNPWQRRVVRRTHSVSSCPESAGLLRRPRLLQKSGQPVWRRTTARLLQKTSQPVWRRQQAESAGGPATCQPHPISKQIDKAQ